MNERIFVIAQDIKVREFFYELLREVGYDVLTIPLATDVAELLKNERPPLIFFDHAPGAAEDIELAKKIRKFDDDIKIVFLCGDQGWENTQGLLDEIGAATTLKKDFHNPEFIKSIFCLLKETRRTDRLETSGKVWGRVLIVDDEVESREMAGRYLERRGFKAETAASGEEALEKIRQNDFEVVLLDITMGGMDGLLVLKRIKEIKPATKVVMVTGLQNNALLAQAQAYGASDYIVKPFNFSILESTLLSLFLTRKIKTDLEK